MKALVLLGPMVVRPQFSALGYFSVKAQIGKEAREPY